MIGPPLRWRSLCALAFALTLGTASAQGASLSLAEVNRVAGQAEQAAESLGQTRFTIAVVDRVGNVLAVFRRGAASALTITSGLPVTGGLEGISSTATGLDLAAVAAISKAVTGAYLSSSGNAFSTRTASFIIQNHFAPGVKNTPGGPLYGVQFSQLPCGDFVQTNDPGATTGIGPRRSPLGLAGDPGGFPLYKAGVVVGGVGVIAGATATYTLDLDPRRPKADLEERIAQAATTGFAPPDALRQITAGGIRLPYSTSDASVPAVTRRVPVHATPQTIAGYTTNVVKAGRAFGREGSGYVPATRANATPALVARHAFILEDGAGRNRFQPKSSVVPSALSATFVNEILQQALGVANQARAQIRRPLNSAAQVTVAVVDVAGNILGVARTPDAPVFSTDVSVQKARTAALFSRRDASAKIRAIAPDSIAGISIPGGARRMNATQRFFGRDVFTGTAFTARGLNNLARPNFPDGIDANGPGPLANGANWSPFNLGLQLDMAEKNVLTALVLPQAQLGSCTVKPLGANNGIQPFAGASPIYAGSTLVGAVGVSGDGIDQDDMVGFLGLQRASSGAVIKGAVGHAPKAIRSDRLGLRYVQCPQSPFINSDAQNVCAGF